MNRFFSNLHQQNNWDNIHKIVRQSTPSDDRFFELRRAVGNSTGNLFFLFKNIIVNIFIKNKRFVLFLVILNTLTLRQLTYYENRVVVRKFLKLEC